MTPNQLIDFKQMLITGTAISTSGTTGDPQLLLQDSHKLKAANRVAIDSQELTKSSRVYTVCKLAHAGGLLAQTLPAIELGADVVVDSFNAYKWVREIKKYTHSHLTPDHAIAIMKTKNWRTLDLTGIWITCGSNNVPWDIITAFVEKGATFMANWGMTEIGPCAINTVFKTLDKIEEYKRELTIVGDRFYCDTTIGPDGQLYVKGDISIHGNNWYATKDIVKVDNNSYYYVQRAS
jgi:acyl-CoA synthetase (AMP-forming)/AMP-acid ligase II